MLSSLGGGAAGCARPRQWRRWRRWRRWRGPGGPGVPPAQAGPHLVCRHRKVWMGKGMPRPPSCSWPSELFLFTMMVAPGSLTAGPSVGSSAAASSSSSSSRGSPQLSSPPSLRQSRLSPPHPASLYPPPLPLRGTWLREVGRAEEQEQGGGAP